MTSIIDCYRPLHPAEELLLVKSIFYKAGRQRQPDPPKYAGNQTAFDENAIPQDVVFCNMHPSTMARLRVNDTPAMNAFEDAVNANEVGFVSAVNNKQTKAVSQRVIEQVESMGYSFMYCSKDGIALIPSTEFGKETRVKSRFAKLGYRVASAGKQRFAKKEDYENYYDDVSAELRRRQTDAERDRPFNLLGGGSSEKTSCKVLVRETTGEPLWKYPKIHMRFSDDSSLISFSACIIQAMDANGGKWHDFGINVRVQQSHMCHHPYCVVHSKFEPAEHNIWRNRCITFPFTLCPCCFDTEYCCLKPKPRMSQRDVDSLAEALDKALHIYGC